MKLFLLKYRTKKFSKGEVIVVQGETPANAYVIKCGVVKTYSVSSGGEEKPITFDVQGEVLPLAWVFGQVHGAPYYYEAFTDCELYNVPREDYVEFITHDHTRLKTAYNKLIAQYLNDQLRVHALGQSKAAAKIVHTLHFLCLRFGKDLRKDTVCVQLPLTQQDLANFVGLTRETTGIELKKLQKSGVLTIKKQRYIVKTNKLHALLDEEYDQTRLTAKQVDLDI